MQKIFHIPISEDLLEYKHQPVSEFIGHYIYKQYAICAQNSFKSYYKIVSAIIMYLTLNLINIFHD